MSPFAHILAGFALGFRHRRELVRVLRKTPRDCSILTLDPSVLKGEGIIVLALDFDGVLSPHGFPAPIPEAQEWLSRCAALFGGANIFILSNKPTDERRRWFAEHCPSVSFISGVRKKPFSDGLKKTGELSGVPLSAILMIDDRLLTGCLAAINAGAQPCYVRRPYISFRHRPFAELFFLVLRTSERVFIRLLSFYRSE